MPKAGPVSRYLAPSVNATAHATQAAHSATTSGSGSGPDTTLATPTGSHCAAVTLRKSTNTGARTTR